jgi:phosphonate transport system ATP-binding protein
LDIAEKYCTRILGINGGRVIFDGKASELNEKIIEKIYEGESEDMDSTD